MMSPHPSQDVARLKSAILEKLERANSALAYPAFNGVDGFSGSTVLLHPKFPQIVYWTGLSDAAALAIRELTKEGQVEQLPTDELAYIAYGQTLEMPIFTEKLAKRVQELKTPHWMPVLLARRRA